MTLLLSEDGQGLAKVVLLNWEGLDLHLFSQVTTTTHGFCKGGNYYLIFVTHKLSMEANVFQATFENGSPTTYRKSTLTIQTGN